MTDAGRLVVVLAFLIVGFMIGGDLGFDIRLMAAIAVVVLLGLFWNFPKGPSHETSVKPP